MTFKSAADAAREILNRPLPGEYRATHTTTKPSGGGPRITWREAVAITDGEIDKVEPFTVSLPTFGDVASPSLRAAIRRDVERSNAWQLKV